MTATLIIQILEALADIVSQVVPLFADATSESRRSSSAPCHVEPYAVAAIRAASVA